MLTPDLRGRIPRDTIGELLVANKQMESHIAGKYNDIYLKSTNPGKFHYEFEIGVSWDIYAKYYWDTPVRRLFAMVDHKEDCRRFYIECFFEPRALITLSLDVSSTIFAIMNSGYIS